AAGPGSWRWARPAGGSRSPLGRGAWGVGPLAAAGPPARGAKPTGLAALGAPHRAGARPARRHTGASGSWPMDPARSGTSLGIGSRSALGASAPGRDNRVSDADRSTLAVAVQPFRRRARP